MTPEELEACIHDAWIDLDGVRQDGDVVVVPGVVDRPMARWGPRARFAMEVRVRGQLDSIEDDEGIGKIPVERVRHVGGALVIEGAIPGRVRVRTETGASTFEVDDSPESVRRWFRWRPA